MQVCLREEYGLAGFERHGVFTSVDKIAAKLVSARASRKITEVHDLFLFMAFHKVTWE